MADDPSLSKGDFETLANFRYQIRKFLRFSEEVSRQHGITPLQYLLLLHIKGYPGRDWATVGELAERLQAQQHGVVALISRCNRSASSSAAARKKTDAGSRFICSRRARRCSKPWRACTAPS